MRFHVAARRYSLRIALGRLIHEGVQVLGAVVRREREIIISATCEPFDRLRVLLRELTRAWVMETGEPTDADGWLSLIANVLPLAMTDLATQGGETALMALHPGESPEPGAARAGVGSARHCAKCSGSVVGASVVWRCLDSALAEMRFYCEFCNHTQIWTELVSAKGRPTAITIDAPTFEKGDTTGVPGDGVSRE